MMRWSERQRAMLKEMGIPPFWPEAAEPAAETPAVTGPSTAVAPAESVPAVSSPVVQAQRPAPQPEPGNGPAEPVVRPAPGHRTASKVVEPAPPLRHRPEGVEQMDWPALRQAVAGCQACTLCDGRTQSVFGVGHEGARWMIVGEAPGEQEDKLGEPFVGRAGQLLDRMLSALGLTRSEASAEQQVFIANVLKCRPPGNRNPLPDEVAQCEPYLLRQIELVQPRLILAMGRFAAQSLLKSSEPIGRLRGRVHQVHGVPVVVTYHPAYLLRNPVDKALVWDDLCLARELYHSPR